MTNDEQKAIQPLLDEVNNIGKRAFKMADNIGFNVTFPNEWEVSVRWGEGHSCDGGKTTVEVAIFDPEDNWYILDGQCSSLDKLEDRRPKIQFPRDELVACDTGVLGYVTPEELTNILQEVAKQ